VAVSHLIVGTAGHIDHGKTSLVRALTGVDLDQLPEERARGITIALGFTHLALPSGRVAAFVDVPGHERLVRTMIAGASGLDAVILCVAAPEGVMPQTREHLHILDLVGVQRGFVALTMCDLADADTIELAQMEIEDVVAGTFLEGQPIRQTAAGSQPIGLEEVVEALDCIAITDRATDGVFRLPVDRAFIQKGFGTVVTGTARAGTIRDGADVRIEPIGMKARIRGMQVHGASVKQTRAGLRTAINLAGIEREDLARGMVIVAEPGVVPASVIDARLRILPSAPVLESAARVRLLVGTAEVMAVTEVIGADRILPGGEGWVQLRTETPIVALPQDRFVLRRQSPVETLGGGTVLDPWAPRARKKRHAAVAAELEALASGDMQVFLSRAGPGGLSRHVAAVRGATDGVHLGDQVIHPHHVQRFEDTLTQRLDTWHAAHPLTPGAPRRELHTGPLSVLDERAFGSLLTRMNDAGTVVLDGPRIRLASFVVQLDSSQAAAQAVLEQSLKNAGLAGLKYTETVAAHGDLLHLLLSANTAVRIGAHVVHRKGVDRMVQAVRDHLDSHGQLKPADFKALTQLSRKHAIPLLEWLDSQRITVRRGDARFAADS
jgi:selenocysteine-specific elongation factor